MAPPCSYCAAPDALKRCGRCISKVYCNRDCQRAAWKAGHKDMCKMPLHSEIPRGLHEKVSSNEAKGIMGDSNVTTFQEREVCGDLMTFDRRNLADNLRAMQLVSNYWLLPLGGDSKPSPLLGKVSKDDIAKALDAQQNELADRVAQTCVPAVQVRYYYNNEAPEGGDLNSNTIQISGSTFDISVVMQ